MLNVTTGTMVMDTYYMHEQMVYELKLIVFKDTRRAEFTQVLYVATGSPPRMEIRYDVILPWWQCGYG